ncbi:hypothetical protein [Arcticibacter tournemirensis]|uniref:Uncharacterized protein n=1 Tax=Arcticibacter tournemirensis TaxID=699437 RepID=A0A4Q0MB49_9SPHI|nr:hypothetical protein [Arcticibacter tournemirensis]RXF70518.1 hypothetical protein EKH83_07700 [Arcticibacter tournemirensis]
MNIINNAIICLIIVVPINGVFVVLRIRPSADLSGRQLRENGIKLKNQYTSRAEVKQDTFIYPLRRFSIISPYGFP